MRKSLEMSQGNPALYPMTLSYVLFPQTII
jgi:hypothetical protein